jgi:hypothetical protein
MMSSCKAADKCIKIKTDLFYYNFLLPHHVVPISLCRCSSEAEQLIRNQLAGSSTLPTGSIQAYLQVYPKLWGELRGGFIWIFIDVSNNFNSFSSSLINPSFHFNNYLVKKPRCNISLSRTNSIIHSYNIRTLALVDICLCFFLALALAACYTVI